MPIPTNKSTDVTSDTAATDERGEPRVAPSAKWNWPVVNFWLDFVMLIAFVSVLWTSVIVRFVFPSSITAEGWTLWTLNLDQWIGLHFNLLAFFCFLVVVHLMLHWSWICGLVASRYLGRSGGKKRNVDDGTRTIWGVGLLIVLLNIMGVGIAAAALMIQRPF